MHIIRHLTFLAILAAWPAAACWADREEEDRDLWTPPAVIRQLRGEERTKAFDAETKAELARAAHEKTYRQHDQTDHTPEAEESFRKIEAQWLALLALVKDTSIERYCVVRCSGLYKYHGEREKGQALVMELDERRKAQRAERARKLAAIPPELNALIEMLSDKLEWKLAPEKIREAVARLPDRSDATVSLLMEHFDFSNDYTFRRQALLALESVGTPKAREALLGVALSDNPNAILPAHAEQAAKSYVASARDKSDARRLLASKTSSVAWVGLDALCGQPVDKPLLEKLGAWLRDDEFPMKLTAARVMTEDPSAELVAEKVRLIVEAIASAASMKKADEIWWPGSHTYAEALRSQLTQSLARMKGADQALKDATPAEKGLTRACVILARAGRLDTGVKDDVVQVLKDTEMGMLRTDAARVLESIGTKADLPLLERLAKSDALERKQGGCMDPDQIYYPVRRAATQAARAIEKREAAKP